MNQTAIISLESTCDLPLEIIKENDFKIIDMDFIVEGKIFSTKTDDVVSSGLYEKMKNGARTSTSQINKQEYFVFFSELIKEGKDIIHLAFSSGLSKTYESAMFAAQEINKKSKNKVYVVDSKCACAGHGLFAILCKDYFEKTKNVLKTIEYLEKIKLNVAHVFSVDNLKYLANGGRIKKTSAVVGNILQIKPVMKMDKEGCLCVEEKAMSRKRALRKMVDKYEQNYDENYNYCLISHADCLEDATYIKEQIVRLRNINCTLTNLGPIIGCHSGPGTIALFFISKNQR